MDKQQLFEDILEEMESGGIAASSPENVVATTGAYGVPGLKRTAEPSKKSFWPTTNKYASETSKLSEKYMDYTRHRPKSLKDFMDVVNKFMVNKPVLRDCTHLFDRDGETYSLTIKSEKTQIEWKLMHGHSFFSTRALSVEQLSKINHLEDLLSVLEQISEMDNDLNLSQEELEALM